MKVLLFLVGVLLLPVCYALTWTMVSLIGAIQPLSRSAFPPPALALMGGFLLWILVYSTLPRPVRTYVLAHELTHALWGALMGSRILRMKISKSGGSVTLTKTNVLITLAPYFFPLYTVLVVAGYYVLSLFVDMAPYYLWWLGLVGFTWGFHLTFTLSSLLQHQSDIVEYGRLFSYAVIWLANVLGICLWIVMVSGVTAGQGLAFLGHHLAATAVFLYEKISALISYAINSLS